jgi:hypothetical protein
MLRPGLVSLSSPSGGGSYTAKAVHFDGTQHLSTNSLAATDNTFMSGAFWFNLPGLISDGVVGIVDPQSSYTTDIDFGNSSGNTNLNINLQNIDTSLTFSIRIHGPIISLDAWHFVIFSGDTSTGTGKVYLDGIDVTTLGNYTVPFTMSFNGLPFFVGDDGASDPVIGDIADLRLAPGQSWLTAGDISPDTLALFQDPITMKPVDPAIATAALGPPAILFSGDASAFGQPNLGTGGAFTLTGVLTNASSSPSD